MLFCIAAKYKNLYISVTKKYLPVYPVMFRSLIEPKCISFEMDSLFVTLSYAKNLPHF